MKKVTIILGPPGSGKSHKAWEMFMAKKEKAIWLSGNNLSDPYKFQMVKKGTELIVMDGVTNLEALHFLITAKSLFIKKKYDLDFMMERPELIVTSNVFTPADFKPRSYQEIIFHHSITNK